MALPALKNWEETRTALHQVTQVIGAVRVASSDALPNSLQYSVAVNERGVSTTELKVGGELKFDIGTFSLHYANANGDSFAIDAAPHSQQSLMQAVLEKFSILDIDLEPSMKHITHDEAFAVDIYLAQDYIAVLDSMYTALARFRGHLLGSMTPIVIWPHHFDMAFIWFATDGMDEHHDPHLAIGFAPFSDGIDRPYIYGYGWSQPTGYVQVELDPPAKAITEGYTGLYAEYDTLRREANLNRAVEKMLVAYHRKASAVLLQE